MYVLTMLPKFFLALVVLLIYVKLSGKSQIAPMSQLDQVGSMVIGVLAGGALLSPSVSAWEATSVVAIWSALLIFIRFIKSKSSKLRDAIDGRPIQLVKNGNLLSDNFFKVNLPIRDFETLINIQGVSNLNELKHVWYELNGSLTIIKKGDKEIATLVIEEGAISKDNLEELDKTESWLTKELKKLGYEKTDDIFCAEWYDNKLWIYPKNHGSKVESKDTSHEKINKTAKKKKSATKQESNK